MALIDQVWCYTVLSLFQTLIYHYPRSTCAFKTQRLAELGPFSTSTPSTVFVSNTANPASTVAVKSRITSRNFAFS